MIKPINMKITTDNIVELIEDYTNTTEIKLNMITKKNGADYQVWKRDDKGLNLLGLEKGLPFSNTDSIFYYYTSKVDSTVIGMNSIYVSEIVSYLGRNKKSFIKDVKIPQLERQLEKYLQTEDYDFAIRNRDFIFHLKNNL